MTSGSEHDAVALILAHDRYLSAEGIDSARWQETVFFPLMILHKGECSFIEDPDAFARHLEGLERKARELGIVRLRTEIRSISQAKHDIVIVGSIRRRFSAADEILGTSSITWTVIRVGSCWKINQIYFNDAAHDPSVTAHLFSEDVNSA